MADSTDTEPSAGLGTAWCPVCRTRRTVTDVHHEGHYEHGREVGYTVTDLDCGHEAQSGTRDLGPAPGAPYAGTQGLGHAASTRAADLAAARGDDPWADQ
jgi:hypothetical protein